MFVPSLNIVVVVDVDGDFAEWAVGHQRRAVGGGSKNQGQGNQAVRLLSITYCFNRIKVGGKVLQGPAMGWKKTSRRSFGGSGAHFNGPCTAQSLNRTTFNTVFPPGSK